MDKTQTRKCKDCKKVKPIDDFPFTDKGRGYRRRSCADCYNAQKNAKHHAKQAAEQLSLFAEKAKRQKKVIFVDEDAGTYSVCVLVSAQEREFKHGKQQTLKQFAEAGFHILRVTGGVN